MSLAPAAKAIDPPPANSLIMHSRVVYKIPSTIIWKDKKIYFSLAQLIISCILTGLLTTNQEFKVIKFKEENLFRFSHFFLAMVQMEMFCFDLFCLVWFDTWTFNIHLVLVALKKHYWITWIRINWIIFIYCAKASSYNLSIRRL